MQVRNDKYGVVLIEIQKNERIYDVINWHFLDNKVYKRKVKKDEKIREKDCQGGRAPDIPSSSIACLYNKQAAGEREIFCSSQQPLYVKYIFFKK